jgi:type I site-specific restriction endonuclease
LLALLALPGGRPALLLTSTCPCSLRRNNRSVTLRRVTDPNAAYLAREAKARIKIDRQLAAAGWFVQHGDQANLTAGLGVAIREFVLEKGHGRVDYLLFLGGQPAGVIEAKWSPPEVRRG